MAPALSEYELQRQKNLEENRKILESIRLEQVTRPQFQEKTDFY